MAVPPKQTSLVPLDAAHADAMVRWMLDPVVSKNLGLRSVPSLEKTRAFIEKAATDPSIVARAILLDGVHVGNVVLDQIDRRVEKAHLHIYIGETSARGSGVGKKALRLMLAHAFGELGLAKVWLTVHVRNAGAIAAYSAVGFEVEGVHRDEFLLDGVRISELYMGCLASDFARRPSPG